MTHSTLGEVQLRLVGESGDHALPVRLFSGRLKLREGKVTICSTANEVLRELP